MTNSQHATLQDTFVEIDGPNGPGLICTHSIRTQPTAANIICRSERELFAVHVRSGVAGQYPNSQRYQVVFNCTGEEDCVEQCRVTVLPVTNCSPDDGEAVLECATGELEV